MDSTASLLSIHGLSRAFGGLMAVENVSFRVREGQIKALIGPNGAGKTTLFNLISGNLRPTAGRVFFLDELVTGLKCHEVAQRGISRTFQTIKLSSTMTVLENVMLGMHTRTRAGFIAGMLNLPWTWSEERTIRDTSHAFLELFSLGNVAQVEVGSLPFGKQRAVEFARALAAEPKLLLLDEPASGLNLHETAELSELIVRIRDMGITILLVEHDMSLVMGISDELVVLNYGRKIAEGTPMEIQQNRDVISIYLGEEDAPNS